MNSALKSLLSAPGRSIVRFVDETADDALFVERFQRFNRRWKLPYSLAFEEASGLFEITSGELRLYAARRERLRKVGNAAARRRQLRKVYMLDHVDLQPRDVVIDVGANIGEFSMLVADLFEAEVVAFEPDDPEFCALERNLQSRRGAARHCLLWRNAGEVQFFSSNATGDSSVFAPTTASESRQRLATTLDVEIGRSDYSDRPVKLLKLEAEGAEPEVLEGAVKTLERTEFVTADLGPERGPEQSTTLASAIALLQDSGFRPVRFFAPRYVMLFRRQ